MVVRVVFVVASVAVIVGVIMMCCDVIWCVVSLNKAIVSPAPIGCPSGARCCRCC